MTPEDADDLIKYLKVTTAETSYLNPIGSYRRYSHRCEVAIALYEKLGFKK